VGYEREYEGELENQLKSFGSLEQFRPTEKGYAFAAFSDESAAKEACEKLSNKPIVPESQRTLKVEAALPRNNTRPRSEPEENKQLYITGYDGATFKEEQARAMLEVYGELTDVFFGERGDFFFCTYAELSMAKEAKEALDGRDLGEGRQLVVNYRHRKEKRPRFEERRRYDDGPRYNDRYGGGGDYGRRSPPRYDDRYGGGRRDDRYGGPPPRYDDRYGGGRDDRYGGGGRDDRYGGGGRDDRYGGRRSPPRDDRYDRRGAPPPRYDDRQGGGRDDRYERRRSPPRGDAPPAGDGGW
jgi:RNA recognition motif-containing protein